MQRVFLTVVIGSLLLASCRPAAPQTNPQPVPLQTESVQAPTVLPATQTPTPFPTPTSIPATPTEAPTATPTPLPPTPAPVSALDTALSKGRNGYSGIHVFYLTTEFLPNLAASGASWTRFDDFHWDEIEPVQTDPPTYNWSSVNEQGLLSIQSVGGIPIGMILFSPTWAQKYPEVFCGPIAEGAMARFGSFVKDLVTRYSQPPYNVKVWEIGNEPDIDQSIPDKHSGFGCWGEPEDPYYGGEYYAEALKTAYPAIKAADPEATVLIGGLLLDCDPIKPPELGAGSGNYKNCTPAKFLEGILKNGGGAFFDGVSFHAYDYYYSLGKYGNFNWNSGADTDISGPVLKPKVAYLRNLLEQYGAHGKLLLNTEVALLCGRDGNEPDCKTEDFAQTKAQYIAQVYAIGLSEGLTANIWYHDLGWRASGLVSRMGAPQPAFDAFTFSSRFLLNVEFSKALGDLPGIEGYEFLRDGKKLWILWSQDTETVSVLLPEKPRALFDMYGKALPVVEQFTVGAAPVYVQFE